MNSHIQMPRFILKGFEDEKHFLYCYNFELNRVINGHSVSLNTEQDYFSDEAEEYLSINMEKPFSDILKFIKGCDFSQSSITLPDDFRKKVLDYTYGLLSRSIAMQRQINMNSIFFQFLSKQNQHDLAAVMGINIGRIDKLLDNFLITIMVNKINIPFVLPISGMCELKYGIVEFICMPVLPKYAIILVKPPIPNFMVENDKIKLWEIVSEDTMNTINKSLFDFEAKRNRRGVVSNNRKLLEDLISDM